MTVIKPTKIDLKMLKEQTTLEVTTIAGCKVACAYCPQALFAIEHRKVTNIRMLSLDRFKICLETVPKNIDIHFSAYSEPFLNPQCIDMVEYAYIKGHRISIFTTLVGMKRSDIKLLKEIDLKGFHIHLPDDGTHMRINVNQEFVELIDEIKKNSIKNIEWIFYFNLHPLIDPIVRDLDLIQKKLITRSLNIKANFIPLPKKIEGPLFCKAKRLKRNVLLPNGDVTLCCNDFGRKHVLGNLTQISHCDLYESDVYKEVVEMMAGKPGELLCRNCEWAGALTE
ncbi:MAG: SPASM domain-containing protein [Haliscomenobacter sp.]|nr:SPASM domain-containing protein [Haliscomenobacter sp.]